MHNILLNQPINQLTTIPCLEDPSFRFGLGLVPAVGRSGPRLRLPRSVHRSRDPSDDTQTFRPGTIQDLGTGFE